MQTLANLQQAVANISVYLGLAPVASTLPIFPHGATGFPTTSSPSLIAVVGVLSPKKQSRVESLRAVTHAIPDEERHNGPLNSACSFYGSTDGDAADPTPQLMPPPTDPTLQQRRREEEEETEDNLAAHEEAYVGTIALVPAAYLEQTALQHPSEATKVLTSCEELLPSPTDDSDEDLEGRDDSMDGNKAKPAPQPLIPIAAARHARCLKDPPQLCLHWRRASQPANRPHLRRSLAPGHSAAPAQVAAKARLRLTLLTRARPPRALGAAATAGRHARDGGPRGVKLPDDEDNRFSRGGPTDGLGRARGQHGEHSCDRDGGGGRGLGQIGAQRTRWRGTTFWSGATVV
ncbi:hypothetical protein GUJ93_ZPchr0001g30392 [Zizania palustris]|uniref:Uncharacterized protein n=1 Tax=Zizania palustris TaxID=103762 RepID=A0A8J5RP19_ZIZPA|nr:hypothetical protein GUJ93_ZPchr0001g30392 [Zizania palustris]